MTKPTANAHCLDCGCDLGTDEPDCLLCAECRAISIRQIAAEEATEAARERELDLRVERAINRRRGVD